MQGKLLSLACFAHILYNQLLDIDAWGLEWTYGLFEKSST